MSEEKLVLVREAGQEDYDIMYLAETVEGPSGPVPLTIELLHQLVREATGKSESEPVTKLSANGIIVRNINGIKFLLKNPEPKLEVTFASTQGLCLLAQFIVSLVLFSVRSFLELSCFRFVNSFSALSSQLHSPISSFGPPLVAPLLSLKSQQIARVRRFC